MAEAGRDFVAEMRALIDAEFHDGDIAPVVAAPWPMNRELALQEGWVDHPACDGNYHLELLRLRRAAS